MQKFLYVLLFVFCVVAVPAADAPTAALSGPDRITLVQEWRDYADLAEAFCSFFVPGDSEYEYLRGIATGSRLAADDLENR